MSFLLAAAAGLLTGLLTGAGIGGGTLLVLYLTTLGQMEQRLAQGVNLLYFLTTAPPALYHHLKNKLVQVRGGLWAAASGSACALAGALLTANADTAALKTAMGVLFILVGLRELLHRAKKE